VLLAFILLTAPGALAMLGRGFGARHIPTTLPDVGFALFTGLNSAAVGLITLAANNLSSKVVTDPLTRFEVLLSAAFAACYESQWLYPVIMAAAGFVTLGWDRWIERRNRLGRQKRQELEATQINNDGLYASPTLREPVEQDIEMHELLVRLVPVAPSSATPAPHSTDTKAPTTPAINADRRTSCLSHINTNLPAPRDHSAEAGIHDQQPVYFSLSVRGGLFM